LIGIGTLCNISFAPESPFSFFDENPLVLRANFAQHCVTHRAEAFGSLKIALY
jgi:hypothetical protein